MNRMVGLVTAVIFGGVLPVVDGAPSVTPAREWQQYASPEQVGWSAEKLEEVRQLSERSFSGAVFVVYKGRVLVAWGDVTRKFKCHSVRKSLLSALFGIYHAEGKVDLNQTLSSLGIDDKPPLSESEKQARVVDLLMARSGVYHPASYEPSSMKANRPKRGSHAPGTHWWYNNWDFNTLASIFKKATGQDVFESFKRRIADPLQMEDFQLSDTFYALEPGSSIHPAYLFRLSARDLARFGLLFANGGKWKDQQIVSAKWVDRSTTGYSDARGVKYGYMWWVYPAGSFDNNDQLSEVNKRRMYRGQGTGGQVVQVIPEDHLVFVHRGDTDHRPRRRTPDTLRMVDMILAAKTGVEKDNPELVAMSAVPFANALSAPKARSVMSLSPDALKSYTGEYFANGSRVRVFLYGGRMFANIDGAGEGELFAESKTVFFAKAASYVVEFELDAKGVSTHVNVTYYGETYRLTRVE